MSKKYEIITEGSLKRIKALRSFHVQDRYVNIGDVGGVVYDDKTLSQEGNAWIFKGRFDFPGARISGDSVIDAGETTTAYPRPNVTIDGTSKIVSASPLYFLTQSRTANVTLTADDFEQGTLTTSIGEKPRKINSTYFVRTKSPIFSGGKSITINCGVDGYVILAIAIDRDGIITAVSNSITTGEGVTISAPAGNSIYIRLAKTPSEPITPADATTAALALVTPPYEGNYMIRDSVISLVDPSGNNYNTFIQSGAYANEEAFKVVNSTINIRRTGAGDKGIYVLANLTNSVANVYANDVFSDVLGNYDNCKQLYFSGLLFQSKNALSANCISGKDCDTLDLIYANLPGLSDIIMSDSPTLKFVRCNMEIARIYNHTQIKNTYTDVDFTLAETELDEKVGGISTNVMASSEVNGMYRIYHTGNKVFGGLVECYESVASLKLDAANFSSTYNSIIYKDAYFNGLFELNGNNVFGNKAPSHPREEVLNAAPRVINGTVNTTVIGETITGITSNSKWLSVENPIRLNGVNGITVKNIPNGVRAIFVYVNSSNVVTKNAPWVASDTMTVESTKLPEYKAYLLFKKSDDTDITPADISGVTVTVYKGCKIVNTNGQTAVTMTGNIRVEDNATLIDAPLNGSCYFGGDALISNVAVSGCAYMKDNTVCTITGTNARTFTRLRMVDNAQYIDEATAVLVSADADMSGNSKFLGTVNSNNVRVIMRDNAVIKAGCVIPSTSLGVLRMEDNATVAGGTIGFYGDITLCGGYRQTSGKAWRGKRVISDPNAPTYDNIVKTQYDF